MAKLRRQRATTFIAIAAGRFHSLALKANGAIIGWGHDGKVMPPVGNDFISIASSWKHSLGLRTDGSLAGWGRNRDGEATPPSGNDFVAIATGQYHSLAIKSDGSIIGWGGNDDGQATPPDGNNFIAIEAGWSHSLALKVDGSITTWGRNSYGQTTSPEGNDFVVIATGGAHSLAFKDDGSIVGWGDNRYGQATPPSGNDFVAIAAGSRHSLALKTDGSIVGWGRNNKGQATPPAGNDFVAVTAGGLHSLALKSDGSIVGWGANWLGQATPPAGNDYLAMVAGEHSSIAIVAANTPPVAVVGPDQEAYAWIDGIADVNLDGSASYDDDGDELTYLWSWQIGSDIYETNGVNPIIELPVGQHLIELIVNDGIEDSEPNYTTVTVIEPLECDLRIMPRVINKKSHGRKITAWLQLPPMITKDDIDDDYPLTMYPGEIEATRKIIFTNMRKGLYCTNIFAFFDRRELLEAVGNQNRVRIEVAGRLTTGQYFYGSRKVRIITKSRR